MLICKRVNWQTYTLIIEYVSIRLFPSKKFRYTFCVHIENGASKYLINTKGTNKHSCEQTNKKDRLIFKEIHRFTTDRNKC